MKVKLGVTNCLYPLSTTPTGANVNGKPNYITIARVGIMGLGSISLGMAKIHYTTAGINQFPHRAPRGLRVFKLIETKEQQASGKGSRKSLMGILDGQNK